MTEFACEMKWENLQGGGEKRRDCAECETPVYNLSGMSRAEALRLFELHGDTAPCIHFVSRDGRIIHNGDPLGQLREQRFGARKLVAGAVALQLGFLAFVDDPIETLLHPLSIFDRRDETFIGELPPPEFEKFRQLDLDPCDSVDECVDAAERAQANAHRESVSTQPGATARAVLEWDKAVRQLDLVPSDRVPEALRSAHAHLAEAELAADTLASEFRVRHHHAQQRKMYKKIKANVLAWQREFPDTDSIWGREALEAERRAKDSGAWPANFIRR